MYKRLPLQRECELLTSDVDTFLKVQIGQGVAEIWPFSIFQDGGRPPSWICYTRVWTTRNLIAVRHSGDLWDYIPDAFSHPTLMFVE